MPTPLKRNPDPVLEASHEHRHEHLHHGAHSDNVDIVYAHDDHIERPVSPLDEASAQRRSFVEEHTYPVDMKHNDSADLEKGMHITSSNELSVREADMSSKKSKWKLRTLFIKYRLYVHIFVWAFFTAWWISIVAQDKWRHEWLVPTLIYICIFIRMVTFHVKASYVLYFPRIIWNWYLENIHTRIPEVLRLPLGGLITVAVILIGTFCTPATPQSTHADRAISFFGCVVAIFGLFITSRNWRIIKWQTVIVGMLLQYLIALFVLRTKAGYDIFNFISTMARYLLGFAEEGVAFVTNEETASLSMFFFSVLPAIMFFIAFVQMLYYWGFIQWIVVKFAYAFFWAMKVSGAEAVVAAASPFIGQGESAILIRPFIPHLTRAEIHQIMCSGFATIAGSVLVAYIGMGINPQALISSCVMSIPASLATSKLRYPETEETLTAGRIVVPDDEEDQAVNAFHAFSNGAWMGLKIAGAIIANMVCIIAIVALIDALLGYFGHFWNINNPPLSLAMILGYILYPVAFLLGAPFDELYPIAKLLATKFIQNEFVAYAQLMTMELSPRGTLLATYALCGFANLGSVGNQIGVLSQIAPDRSGDIATVAFSALITGYISTLTSAAVAGMTMADVSHFSASAS
ncbi:hypothetical protein CANCADRAFT_31062 [Tortispora caseinolytica NRRL Y-17796]|uniref:Concentrative nucleoside transporter C-terminal domain-containing protein n=1 Tax=Tortispora caseinolytica NRRL Y-17796 TaxID=767744 RepID=A0A1E4TDV3_9ASCO|nr:hypothetical protein CANCADRAFT_31062 [Tortispora caseinolytica NRRL Y-17796]